LVLMAAWFPSSHARVLIGCCGTADLLLLCVVHLDAVETVEQHLHVLCSLVPDWLCQLPASRSILCIEAQR